MTDEELAAVAAALARLSEKSPEPRATRWKTVARLEAVDDRALA